MKLMQYNRYYLISIESVLAYCLSSVWYAICSAADRRALQRVIGRLSSAHCPLWGTYSVTYSSVEQPTCWKTYPTLDIICLTCCPLVDASRPSNHGQTDLRTASTTESFESWTLSVCDCQYYNTNNYIYRTLHRCLHADCAFICIYS